MIEMYVNAEELKRLLSSLFLLLGALLIGGLFAIIVVPGLRNANKPAAPTPVNPVVGEPGWLDPTEFPPARGREMAAVDPQTLLVPSPELISRGKEIYAKECVSCHGSSGRGDGPAAPTMNPRPRNFTNPDGWTRGYGLPAIYETLSRGVQGTSMASFDYYSRSDRMALAHFVQELSALPKDTASPDAVESLSRELASPGGRTPNRIPVSMAMVKLEEEFSAVPPLAVDPEDQSAGAEIFRRVAVDPSRAAQVLARSLVWRESPVGLANFVLAGAPGNGFSVNAATLGPDEWEALLKTLLSLQ